jgi:hypothetical protein
MSTPAIVVVAYNRPKSLERILHSIQQAHFSNNSVPLIISIDKSGSDDVFEVARNFQWKHGVKKIIQHPQNLGLKEHILSCGDLTETYDEIILLEDDLFVSPYFYEYATKALGFYSNEEKIGGISLYSYDMAENGFYPFYPVNDNSDVYFVQIAASWGQAWNKKQWGDFRRWFEKNRPGIIGIHFSV